jgi:hypothetical protein
MCKNLEISIKGGNAIKCDPVANHGEKSFLCNISGSVDAFFNGIFVSSKAPCILTKVQFFDAAEPLSLYSYKLRAIRYIPADGARPWSAQLLADRDSNALNGSIYKRLRFPTGQEISLHPIPRYMPESEEAVWEFRGFFSISKIRLSTLHNQQDIPYHQNHQDDIDTVMSSSAVLIGSGSMLFIFVIVCGVLCLWAKRKKNQRKKRYSDPPTDIPLTDDFIQ